MVTSVKWFLLFLMTMSCSQTNSCPKNKKKEETPQPNSIQCPSNYVLHEFGGTKICLYLAEDEVHYDSAFDFCIRQGKTLFQPQTPDQLEILRRFDGVYYVGIASSNNDGVYNFNNGNAVNQKYVKENFYQEADNEGKMYIGNKPEKYSCVVYSSYINRKLVETGCLTRHKFICQG